MTNQQKIEFYLSKGFAVEVENEEGDKDKLYCGGKDGDVSGVNAYGNAGTWTKHWLENIVKVTPIPPKPYEFEKGDRVITETGETKTIEMRFKGSFDQHWYRTTDNDDYPWYELAPALPEDEECEVVEVLEWDACPSLRCCKDKADVPVVWSFTKPDGKKLKIKVIKP